MYRDDDTASGYIYTSNAIVHSRFKDLVEILILLHNLECSLVFIPPPPPFFFIIIFPSRLLLSSAFGVSPYE